MKSFILAAILVLRVVPSCEDDPSPVSENPISPAIRPTDFRQVEAHPHRFEGQIVLCKLVGNPGSLEQLPSLTERLMRDLTLNQRFGHGLNQSTKIGQIRCEGAFEPVRILVQPEDEERYYSLRVGYAEWFKVIVDYYDADHYALRFKEMYRANQ